MRGRPPVANIPVRIPRPPHRPSAIPHNQINKISSTSQGNGPPSMYSPGSRNSHDDTLSQHTSHTPEPVQDTVDGTVCRSSRSKTDQLNSADLPPKKSRTRSKSKELSDAVAQRIVEGSASSASQFSRNPR